MQLLFGDCELDAERYELRRDGKPVALEPQAFEVLAYLAANRDRVVSRQELLDAVWGTSFITDGALATRIKEARRAVGDDGQRQDVIRTIHRRGYRFVAEASEVDGARATAPPVPHDTSHGPPTQPVPNAVAATALLPGRDGERATLQRLRADVEQGQRRVVFLTGEAGIGKSSLARAFTDELAASDGIVAGRGECIEHHGPGEPFLPLLESLTSIVRNDPDGAVAATIRRLAPT